MKKTLLFLFLVFFGVVLVAYATTVGPNSPATTVDDATVGTLAWTNPNNTQISDNIYATRNTGGITHYVKATNYGFTIPTGSVITGITVGIERKASAASSVNFVRDKTIKIVKSDGTFGTVNKANTGVNWPTTEATANYGGSSDLWSETWTAEDINDVDFGVGVSAENTVDTAVTASIDYISITVDYTTPTSQHGKVTLTSGTASLTQGTLIVP